MYDSHCFNVSLATKLGLAEALVFQHFWYWHQYAQNIPEMSRDGRVWFYRSIAEMREVFPYLSDANIRTAVAHLLKDGYIVKGDYSERSMNKSTWYSLSDLALQMFDLLIPTNPFIDSTNGLAESANVKNNSNKEYRKIVETNKNNNTPRFDFRQALIDLGVSVEVADAWMQVRKAARASNTEVAFKGVAREIAKSGLPADDCIRTAVERSWRGFNADWMKPRDTPQAPRPERRYISPEERTLNALARLQARDGMLHTFTPEDQ